MTLPAGAPRNSFADLAPWRKDARKALDNWIGPPELTIAEALTNAFKRGVAFAAGVAEKDGQPELARKIRAAERPAR